MTKTQIKMTLERPARKSGGDRYEGTHEGEKLTLYFPQSISRQT